MELGKYNTLRIVRESDHGLYLSDSNGNDVLLPNKYCPESFEIDEELKVFVYLDANEVEIATTIEPFIVLNEFALLEVADVSGVGAFMDIGLEKQLFVPFAEQKYKMVVGETHVVCMKLDEETDRLYGSSKLSRHTQNVELEVAVGDKVEALIFNVSDLGYNAIINDQHIGLLFKNEVFKSLEVGQRCDAYVKKIREKNKIDLSLQPIGYQKFNEPNSKAIYEALVANGGVLHLGDKSPAEEIYERFGISKKAFKRALGDLYKQRRVSLAARETTLIPWHNGLLLGLSEVPKALKYETYNYNHRRRCRSSSVT